MHGLIFKTSICYWQDQPGIYRSNKSLSSQENMLETLLTSPKTNKKELLPPRGPQLSPVVLLYLSIRSLRYLQNQSELLKEPLN